MAFDPEKLKQMILSSGVPYKQNSISWIFRCPRCGKDDKVYCYKVKYDGHFKCWVCAETDNYKGRPEYLLSDLLNRTVRDIKEELYGGSSTFADPLDIGGIDDVEDDIIEIENKNDTIPSVEYPLDYRPLDHPLSAKGLAYLEGRGISLELANKYQLRYASEAAVIAFPVHRNGRLVGYQKRLVGPNRVWLEDEGEWYEKPKITSSVNIPRDRTLMFEHRLINSPHAVICEGPIDGIKLDLANGNVAAMGKAIASQQLDIIKRSGVRKIYFGLDPDAAPEMERLQRELYGLEHYILIPPRGIKDLGEMSVQDAYQLFLSAPLINPNRIFLFFRGSNN